MTIATTSFTRVSDSLFSRVIFEGTEPFAAIGFGKLGVLEEPVPPTNSTSGASSVSAADATDAAPPSPTLDSWAGDEIFWVMTPQMRTVPMLLWLEMAVGDPAGPVTDYSEYWGRRVAGNDSDTGITLSSDPSQPTPQLQ